MNAVQGDYRAERDDVTLRELLSRLWAGRSWILTCVAVFIAVAVAAAFLMTPVYRAVTVLVPASTERSRLGNSLGSALGSLGGLAALAGVNVGSMDAATEEALAVLRSREFTEKFIRDNRLMPVFFSSKWDAGKGQWKAALDRQPTVSQAFKYFDRKIRTVVQDKKTGLVTLQIDWKDRRAAPQWANQLVQRLNAEMRRRAIAQTDASLGFLQKELAATTVVETRSAISRLTEAQINQRMIANVTSEYAFRVVDPAMVSDKRDVVRPRKLQLIVLGLFSGSLLGVVGVLLFRRPT